MKISQTFPRRRKGALRALKMLQKFGLRVPEQMRALFSILRFLLGKIEFEHYVKNYDSIGKKIIEYILTKPKFRRKNQNFEQPHSAEKHKEGTLWDFLTSNLLQTICYRPKSASYLRLKNSKKTSKCQSILFHSTQKMFSNKVSQCQKN